VAASAKRSWDENDGQTLKARVVRVVSAEFANGRSRACAWKTDVRLRQNCQKRGCEGLQRAN
jgi:hypothetical protein